ncbi:metallophosphoesterase [Nakamurella deserti]|uniref:metallophosphoesterase n=1 Tax=Nakamurella deserti TaxID=2164074 RepID=UPI000DBE72F8|nr:metallophosphoesterase [Nakamurella deserti]
MPAKRRLVFSTVLVAVLALLHGVPWLVLVLAPGWPTAVTVTGTVLAVGAAVGFPVAMWQGHGARHRDRAAVAGDVWLGVVWQLFAWTLVAGAAELVAVVAGADRTVIRGIAVVALIWIAGLLLWGHRQAMRVPPVRWVDVRLPRLGADLDGFRVAMITDTHFGPLDRSRWSAAVADVVNGLDADLVAHAGDMADGSVEQRRGQAAPLARMTAREGRVYITGNHEYMSGAAAWTAHLEDLGWTVLRNRHLLIRRGAATLAVAGVDDRTAAGSGVAGHGTDLARALHGVDPDHPVLLLSHQPRQVSLARAAGVDLQLSGHTHGGQMWPFHLLVRAEQGVLQGLSRHGDRTQLYTSRGSGFWGPPFRIFAPNEITLLTLRAG